ncbi:MAG: integration host factor subunit alpha [Gammaproteobacteria bacterium]|jgi:integration host factor subunit alpha|nr:integration host factor subunit alpha [Gammaproteobacteria bacterium]
MFFLSRKSKSLKKDKELKKMAAGIALGRAGLIKNVSRNSGLTRQEIAEILEKTLEEIGKALESGEDVKITSFGTFSIHHKKERMGRNPRTGKAATVSSRKVISFKASNAFKRSVLLELKGSSD